MVGAQSDIYPFSSIKINENPSISWFRLERFIRAEDFRDNLNFNGSCILIIGNFSPDSYTRTVHELTELYFLTFIVQLADHWSLSHKPILQSFFCESYNAFDEFVFTLYMVPKQHPSVPKTTGYSKAYAANRASTVGVKFKMFNFLLNGPRIARKIEKLYHTIATLKEKSNNNFFTSELF